MDKLQSGNIARSEGDTLMEKGEAKFHLLAEMAPLAIFIFQDLRIKYVNPATERMTGYSRTELLGRSIALLFPAGMKKVIREWGKQIQQGNQSTMQGELTIISKTGEDCCIDLTVAQTEYNGTPAVLGTAFEKNTQQKEKNLQDIVYRIAREIDKSKTLDDLLPVLHTIISEAMVAKNFYFALIDQKTHELTYPYYVDEFDRPSRKVMPEKGLTEYVMRKGKSFLCTADLHKKLEEQGEIELVGTPLPIWLGVPLVVGGDVIGAMVVQDYDNAGAYGIREQRILEFVSSQVAMTIQHKISEDALRESAERYRRLVELGPEVVAVHCEGKIVYINQAGVSLLGAKSVAEILGRPVMDFVHPDFVPIFEERIKHSQEEYTVEPAIYEKFVCLDGSIIDVEVVSIPIDFEGKPATQVVLHDVTERKRVEDALRESEARYRRRAEELSALYDTTREIASQHETQILLQTIVERAAVLLNADGGSIYLRDRERNELELRVAHGYQGLLGMRILPGEGLSGEVMQTLQPVIVDDYRTWKNRSPKFSSIQATAVMATPMLNGGELLGVLTVHDVERGEDTPVRKFTSSDMEQLTFFAGAAASAVHNAGLFEETRQHLVELELLYQASLSAAQIHSPHAVAQRIVDTLEELLSWSGSIWLNEDQHLTLLAVGAMGLAGKAYKERFDQVAGLVRSLEEGIVGWVCKNGRPFRSGNVKENPHYIKEREEINSELCVPLKIGGKCIGCINVESEGSQAFNEQDERLLTTLANQAAVTIENARLFEEMRRRASRQVALNAIIRASARTGAGLNEILDVALDQTLHALDLDMGTLWLSWSSRSIQRIVSRGIPVDLNTLMVGASGERNVSLRRTLVINDWQKTSHSLGELFLSIGIHSSIIVPLLSEGRLIGGMAACSPDTHLWTTDEISLVEAIGREIGLAAERARLSEETDNRLKEMEAVNRVSTALRSAQSLDEMLPHLVAETFRALDTEAGGIWLYDPDERRLHQVIGRGWCLKASKLVLDSRKSFIGNVLTTEDVYFSSDIATDPKASDALREFAPPGWSAVSVPIRSEAEVNGVFMVSAPSPREFSSEDAQLLVTLSEIAGNTIHRMRLNEKILQHAAELEMRVAERTAELQTALQKARAADRVKSEFVANINHELRTPLTNLILYYQMLRAQPNVKMDERLDVIGRELQRLRILIEDLLNLSRLDLGHVIFNPTLSDLNSLIQTLVKDRQALAGDRGLSLFTELQPNLEPVMLDEQTMSQAISNLLTNALNYTPLGGQVWIRTLSANEHGDHLVAFSVEDSGLGISPEDMPHLFERFYRGAAGRQTGVPGTGLGLAIVKQVVDHHHGRIDVQNGPAGHGTKFTVWLPVKPPQEAG